jgi:peptidoglycan L-alanyl-D-glutamate endopeptidase CwlK
MRAFAIAVRDRIRSLRLGAEVDSEITLADGSRIVARVERHYHPPGGTMRPWGRHLGVSLFARPATCAGAGGFKLGTRSRACLVGVHPDLVRVVERAIEITAVDFTVLEGVRTVERQRSLVESGASRTLASRHLTGHAVDLAPWIRGAVSWDWADFHRLAPWIKRASAEVGVAVEWGGDWKSFPDGPHWQLPRGVYP